MQCWQKERKCNLFLSHNTNTSIYMNTNNYFSFSRLWLVMKRDLMENWKTNLYVFIGIFGAYLLSYLVSMSRFNEILYLERVPSFDQYSKSHWSFFGSCAIALLLYFASHTMKNMKTKENRLAYLMLPLLFLQLPLLLNKV